MGETPDEIRDEIEDTRTRMSETAEAIGYKADVKSRMKESVAEKKDALVGSISEGKDAVVGTADSLVSRMGGIVPDSGDVREGAARVGVSRQNPLGLAIAGVAGGFILGTLLPRTRAEDEKLGPISDDVTAKAKEVAHESVERGKSVAEDAMAAAARTAQERGDEELDEMSSSLQEKAREVGQTTQPPRA
jgi:uncharacterized protein DUF3618